MLKEFRVQGFRVDDVDVDVDVDVDDDDDVVDDDDDDVTFNARVAKLRVAR